jgi:pimeloyl-ACP methyl ester carboxylesterase
MESKGIAERVVGRPKRSQLYWLAAGILLQFPGRLGDLGFGHIMKPPLPNYCVRPDSAPKGYDVTRASKRAGAERTGLSRPSTKITRHRCLSTHLYCSFSVDQDVIRETNAVLAKRFPAATNVRIENAAHFPWLEQPDAFAKTILGFYREVIPVGAA